MWATQVIDRAKGAEGGCAVGSAPLGEMLQSVPAQASASSKVNSSHPRLAVKLVALVRRVWSWVTIGVLICVIVQLASLLYSATFPLRVGGKVHPRAEYMSYWRRFLAVSVLRIVRYCSLSCFLALIRAPPRCIYNQYWVTHTCARNSRSSSTNLKFTSQTYFLRIFGYRIV